MDLQNNYILHDGAIAIANALKVNMILTSLGDSFQQKSLFSVGEQILIDFLPTTLQEDLDLNKQIKILFGNYFDISKTLQKKFSIVRGNQKFSQIDVIKDHIEPFLAKMQYYADVYQQSINDKKEVSDFMMYLLKKQEVEKDSKIINKLKKRLLFLKKIYVDHTTRELMSYVQKVKPPVQKVKLQLQKAILQFQQVKPKVQNVINNRNSEKTQMEHVRDRMTEIQSNVKSLMESLKKSQTQDNKW